jgi:hypothetical protein
MEPEVHIIEKYFQEVYHCFTMTNIRCKGGREIDLLAVSPTIGKKYHVESSVLTPRGFHLKEKDLDYFKSKKFDHPVIIEKIRELFGDLSYEKILVVFNTQDNFRSLSEIAEKQYGICIQGIQTLVAYFNKVTKGSRMTFLEHWNWCLT